MNSHDFHDSIPLSDFKDIQRIFWAQTRTNANNYIEELFWEKSKLEKKLWLGETRLTEIIQKFFIWPIWKSLCWILQEKSKNKQQEKITDYEEKILREENLEIFNLLVNGHNGKDLPWIAAKNNKNSLRNDDYYF